MAIEPLISWTAPTHVHREKKSDWFFAVGIITLALAAIAFIFGEVITGIFVIVAATALVLHASHPPHRVRYEINDRGIAVDETLYPFLSLDSFWIPHDHFHPKIILKSRKLFMPLTIILIEGVDQEEVRAILLKYIAETEHHESWLKHLMEWVGF